MTIRQACMSALVVAAAVASPAAVAQGDSLYDTAVVHYEFETLGTGGEVVDSSANGINLRVFDSTGAGATAELVPGPNAVGHGIRLPDGVVLTTTGTGSDDSMLDVTRDTPFTIAAWVKLENVGDRLYLASKVMREEFEDGDGLELRGWSFDVGAGGKLTGIWRYDHTPTTGAVGDARIIVDSTTTITDTQWHHIALTFDYDEADETRGMRLYLDGLLQPMTASSTGLAGVDDIDLSAPGWPFNVSGRYDSQLNEGGVVDDLAIWKSALSAEDIASLAGVSLGGTGDFDGDGDVDGQDFLIWQRGESPNSLSAADLSDWQARFGAAPAAAASAVAAVPEPVGMALLAMGFVGLGILKRRR